MALFLVVKISETKKLPQKLEGKKITLWVRSYKNEDKKGRILTYEYIDLQKKLLECVLFLLVFADYVKNEEKALLGATWLIPFSWQ